MFKSLLLFEVPATSNILLLFLPDLSFSHFSASSDVSVSNERHMGEHIWKKKQ